MTQRYAGMLRRNAGEWDKREMPVQAECLRQAARHMEDRERTLADEIATLRAKLAAAEARAERLARLLLEVDDVALKIVSDYGVVDAIDNDGDAYQSQALRDELQAIRAALAEEEAG